MFFMLFTTILQKDFEKYDKLLETYESKCFQTENQYYIFFLNGLKAYLNKNYKKAIENLLEITYSNNKYMAIWGKLLEIRIHKDLGDHKIVDMLKDRAIRFLKTNQSQLFYYNPSMKCLELLDAPESEKRNEHLFDFYKLILLGNTEKQQTQ
jgi:tetratricopeptide (TPR) repeat protein